MADTHVLWVLRAIPYQLPIKIPIQTVIEKSLSKPKKLDHLKQLILRT